MGLIEYYERAFEGTFPEGKKFLMEPFTAQRLKAMKGEVSQNFGSRIPLKLLVKEIAKTVFPFTWSFQSMEKH